MTDAGYITIGKVVEKLKPQYPDLSVSKLRFYENEGLLVPSSRTAGGYRLYSARDVARLEKILHMQKTKFLPLCVIKEELEKQTERSKDSDMLDDFQVQKELESQMHSLESIPELLGVSVAFVRQLAEIQAITLTKSPQGRELVSGRDIGLIKACDALKRFGIEPKHLRQYVTAANRETAMFEQALFRFAPHKGELDEKQTQEFDEAIDKLLLLTNVLRSNLIKKRVEEDFSITHH